MSVISAEQAGPALAELDTAVAKPRSTHARGARLEAEAAEADAAMDIDEATSARAPRSRTSRPTSWRQVEADTSLAEASTTDYSAVAGSESVCSEASEGVAEERAEEAQPLFIFDWDDTLLPTSWLVEHGLLDRDGRLMGLPSAATPEEEARNVALASSLARADRAACGLLDEAGVRGAVVIVTAGSPGWVEQSAEAFMPRTLDRVRWLRVMPRWAGTGSLAHKMACFNELAFTMAPSAIVSVGDSAPERCATLALAGRMPGGAPAHSVATAQAPCADDLADQGVVLKSCLPTLASHGASLDLVLCMGAPQADGSRTYALNRCAS